MMMEVPDILSFKIIVVGYQGVGKSSLITRYIKGEFLDHYNVTVGVEYSTKIVTPQPGKQVRLQIWDTAGQELFRSLVKSFYKGISAVFFVYSIDNLESFLELKSWIEEVREYAHEEVVVFLIAAKADIQDKREVSSEMASTFLREIQGAFHLETSAKTGLNIQLLFKKAAEELLKKYASSSAFKRLVSPNQMLIDNGSRQRGNSMSLRRNTIQRETSQKRRKKCCQ